MLTNQNPLLKTFALASQNDAFNQEKAQVGAFSVIEKLPTSRRFISSSITDTACVSLSGFPEKRRHAASSGAVCSH